MKDSPSAILPPAHFPVSEGELVVGGHRISELAQMAGGTPFYAYDRGAIAARVTALRERLPPGFRLHYALKANPHPGLVAFMAGQVDGFDIASAGELELALRSGMAPARIGFAGPGKREPEIARAVAAGIVINAESARDLDLAAHAARQGGRQARCALRVNPRFELRGAGMKMGGAAAPFGVDEERVPDLLRAWPGDAARFEGFQIYAGSQSLRGDALAACLRAAWRLALDLAAHAPSQPASINLGGGFGIPYFPGEVALDLTPVAAALADVSDAARREMPGTSLILELGRYLVGEAGVFVTTVLDVKESRGRRFLVVDGGLNSHLAASGNFGQVLRKNYPLWLANRMDAAAAETASVVGPLCTPLDLLGDNVRIPHAHPGDLVVIFQSGAYGASASPHEFLGHPRVAELLV